MPVFKYTAMDKSKIKKSGEIEAADQRELRAKLKGMGLIMLSANKKSGLALKGKKKEKKEKKKGLFAKVKVKERAIFTRQIATMISSGVSLLRSITILAEQNENPLFKEILMQVKEDLTSGIAFSEALAKHPKQFDKLFVSMVKAGEASGSLEVVLERLSDSMEKAEELKGKVKGAMMYPIIVLIVAGIITVLLLTFVIPKFTQMFTEANMKLPAVTMAVVNLSHLLQSYWWILLGGVVGTVIGFKKYYATEKGKKSVDTILLKLPLFGDFLRKVSVGRFTRTMATLLDSGVPILTAFDIVADVVGNTVMSETIRNAKSSIKEGNTIAKPLEESGKFPVMVTQMIEIGEESGAITEMLSKVADFNEREVEEAVTMLVSAMEPLTIVIMAITVGTMVIAMFLPMFSLGDLAGNMG